MQHSIVLKNHSSQMFGFVALRCLLLSFGVSKRNGMNFDLYSAFDNRCFIELLQLLHRNLDEDLHHGRTNQRLCLIISIFFVWVLRFPPTSNRHDFRRNGCDKLPIRECVFVCARMCVCGWCLSVA